MINEEGMEPKMSMPQTQPSSSRPHSPIKVFIGVESGNLSKYYSGITGVNEKNYKSNLLAAQVLSFCIKKFSSMATSIEIVDWGDVFRNNWELIPKLCNYQGRAIYFDASMLLYQDLANIWTLPIADDVLHISSLDKSCNAILFDCSKFLKGKGWKAGCVYQNKIPILDSSKAGSGKDSFLIKFRGPYRSSSSEEVYPWLSNNHPYGKLWYDLLQEAMKLGFIKHDFVQDQMDKGLADKSLMAWLKG